MSAFHWRWPRRSVCEAVKPPSGNSLTVANSIWFGPGCPRQSPAAGPRQNHHKGPFQCRRAVLWRFKSGPSRAQPSSARLCSIGTGSNLDGTTVNASLISGLTEPFGIALDGAGHMFVTDYAGGTIGEDNLDGTAVNASLISGLNSPAYLALDGNGHLFVANLVGHTVGEYNVDGTPVNGSLISGFGRGAYGHSFGR